MADLPVVEPTIRVDRAIPRMSGPREATVGHLATAAVGLVPVSLVGATAFCVAELHTLATRVLAPVLAASALALRRRHGRLLGTPLAAGVVATLLYDAFRFGFIGAQWIHGDPIPHIGEALHLEPAWAFGYLWR